jgi:hypothetical protein
MRLERSKPSLPAGLPGLPSVSAIGIVSLGRTSSLDAAPAAAYNGARVAAEAAGGRR